MPRSKAFHFKPLAFSESLSLSFPFWKAITSLTAWQGSWELSDIRAYECGTALKVTKAQGKGGKRGKAVCASGFHIVSGILLQEGRLGGLQPSRLGLRVSAVQTSIFRK